MAHFVRSACFAIASIAFSSGAFAQDAMCNAWFSTGTRTGWIWLEPGKSCRLPINLGARVLLDSVELRDKPSKAKVHIAGRGVFVTAPSARGEDAFVLQYNLMSTPGRIFKRPVKFSLKVD